MSSFFCFLSAFLLFLSRFCFFLRSSFLPFLLSRLPQLLSSSSSSFFLYSFPASLLAFVSLLSSYVVLLQYLFLLIFLIFWFFLHLLFLFFYLCLSCSRLSLHAFLFFFFSAIAASLSSLLHLFVWRLLVSHSLLFLAIVRLPLLSAVPPLVRLLLAVGLAAAAAVPLLFGCVFQSLLRCPVVMPLVCFRCSVSSSAIRPPIRSIDVPPSALRLLWSLFCSSGRRFYAFWPLVRRSVYV